MSGCTKRRVPAGTASEHSSEAGQERQPGQPSPGSIVARKSAAAASVGFGRDFDRQTLLRSGVANEAARAVGRELALRATHAGRDVAKVLVTLGDHVRGRPGRAAVGRTVRHTLLFANSGKTAVAECTVGVRRTFGVADVRHACVRHTSNLLADAGACVVTECDVQRVAAARRFAAHRAVQSQRPALTVTVAHAVGLA